jgi:hypothetical protein
MAITMYQISVPVFTRQLRGLASCMEKTQTRYAEKKLDEKTLLNYRLYPDMFNFIMQVGSATSHAMNCIAMLAGVPAPRFDDTPASLADLIVRVEKTLEFIQSIKPEQINDTDAKEITMKMRDREMKMTGLELLQDRSMPNFYFHATTAYAIMRHNGVEIGKRDFMGG